MFTREEQKKLPHPFDLSLVANPRKKNNPKCDHCGLAFKRLEDLKTHMEGGVSEEHKLKILERSIKCRCCSLMFVTKQGYRQHIGKVHIKSYKYSKCQICSKKFRNKYAVKFHVKQVHDKATREACEVCGKIFYNKYLLPKHLEKCRVNS